MSYFDKRIEKYNKPRPLNEYFIPLIGDKKEVSILDVGSGPYPITGQTLNGVKVNLTHCDSRGFDNFWANHNTTPLYKVEVNDMEKLSYPDNSFDIVHCVNALDHTIDAESAVKEMIRVAKDWVYIDCSLHQHTVRRKKHYWDAHKDGTFTNETGQFDLKDYGFKIEFIEKGGEPQYDQIIATLEV